MHIVAHPLGAPPVEEPHLAIRIPARVQNPAAQVLSHPWHRVGVKLRAIFLDLPDLAFQRLAQRFVCIQRKNPVILTTLGGVVFLPRKAAPHAFEDTRAMFGGQLHGSIRRPAVHHDDFVTTSQTLDHARNIALLVKCDDRGRDLHRGLLIV